MRRLGFVLIAAGLIMMPSLARAYEFRTQRWTIPPAVNQALLKGDYSAALVMLHAELAKCEASRPNSDECVTLLQSISRTASAAGEFRKAENFARRVVALAEGAARRNEISVAAAYTLLGGVYSYEEMHAEAELYFRKALEVELKFRGRATYDFVSTYRNLGMAITHQRRAAEGEPFLRTALTLSKSDQSGQSWASALNNLGFNLNAQGRHAEAESVYREVLRLRKLELATSLRVYGEAYNNLGSTLNLLGRFAEAEPLQRQAIRAWELELPPGHIDTAKSYGNLASTLNALRRFDEAEALYRKSLSMRLKLRVSNPHRIKGYQVLATHLLEQKRTLAEVWSLYSAAAAGVHERVRSFPGFTRAAQVEVLEYRPIFIGQVRTAWSLSGEPR